MHHKVLQVYNCSTSPFFSCFSPWNWHHHFLVYANWISNYFNFVFTCRNLLQYFIMQTRISRWLAKRWVLLPKLAYVDGRTCRTSKIGLSLYQFFAQLPTHQYTIFNRKIPNLGEIGCFFTIISHHANWLKPHSLNILHRGVPSLGPNHTKFYHYQLCRKHTGAYRYRFHCSNTLTKKTLNTLSS